MRFKLRKRILLFKVSPFLRKRFSGGLSLMFLGLLLVGGFYLLDYKIRPVLKYLTEAKARQVTTEAINEAINFKIAPNLKYENMINVSFDKDGKVALMQPNSREINRLTIKATLAVQKKIKNLAPQMVRLPLGQVFGLKIFTNIGPDLPLKLQSIGIVESAISDNFDVAGINQIRHRIKINIKTEIKIVVPLVYQQVRVNTSVLLTEAIVMGEVPHIYVNGGGLIVPGDSRK
ncbi:MAG: sporulation protein YunB [Bacillota bacterium]|jgi:sporulation protein YunB